MNIGIGLKQDDHGLRIIPANPLGVYEGQCRIVEEEDRSPVGFNLGNGLGAVKDFGLKPGHVFVQDLRRFPDAGFGGKNNRLLDLDWVDDSGNEREFPGRLLICHVRG